MGSSGSSHSSVKPFEVIDDGLTKEDVGAAAADDDDTLNLVDLDREELRQKDI